MTLLAIDVIGILGWTFAIGCVLTIAEAVRRGISDAMHHRNIAKWLNERAAKENEKRRS